MTKKLYIGLGILFTISISIFIFNAIYQGSVPKIVEEINNSSIGAILTAIITVLLLSQQSSSEEVKERNVRVFEEKSARFNTFINKLWDIWDDRVVSLEELNELIKLVSKDIVLYDYLLFPIDRCTLWCSTAFSRSNRFLFLVYMINIS